MNSEIASPPLGDEARRQAGLILRCLQAGKLLDAQCIATPSTGVAVHELRIEDGLSTVRLVYRVDDDALVLAAFFQGLPRRTPTHVTAIAKARLRVYDDDETPDRETQDGWVEGDYGEFLGLSEEQVALVEIKFDLVQALNGERVATLAELRTIS